MSLGTYGISILKVDLDGHIVESTSVWRQNKNELEKREKEKGNAESLFRLVRCPPSEYDPGTLLGIPSYLSGEPPKLEHKLRGKPEANRAE